MYDHQPSRKTENAEKFLERFSGWLHADGYQGYHKQPEQIRVVGCWAHARHKFVEVLTAVPKERQSASDERSAKRYEQEKPVLEGWLAWENALKP